MSTTAYTSFLNNHYYNSKTPRPTQSKKTHTRIADPTLGIKGGCYCIEKKELPEFYELYYQYVFELNNNEYLTELQINPGPMLVDFDFRYSTDITIRQHTNKLIYEMITCYMQILNEVLILNNQTFNIHIFEKPEINTSIPNIVKDGIHMIIELHISHEVQEIIRNKMLIELPKIWNTLLITNTWDQVLDETITKGTTGWQLYGSRKPGNEAYKLTNSYTAIFINDDIDINIDNYNYKNNIITLQEKNKKELKQIISKKNFNKLTAHYEEHYHPILSQSTKTFLENKDIKKFIKKTTKNPIIHSSNRIEENDKEDEEDEEDEDKYKKGKIPLIKIINKIILDKAIEQMLVNFYDSDYILKEIHEYTQILPEKYYKPGSHYWNRQVAFALKHTDERLFLSWVLLRSKAVDFDYSEILNLYELWKKYYNTSGDCVTHRSIIYWAKQDAFEEYQRVKWTCVSHYINLTETNPTDFGIAQVLYQQYKDQYICSDISNKKWHVFHNHHWHNDKGLTLRKAMSTDICKLYGKRRDTLQHEYNEFEKADDHAEKLSNKIKLLNDIIKKMQMKTNKDNIMREAMELFFDGDFIQNLDSNIYLLGCKNGVIDFKNKVFRDGYPQDYISISTGIDYIPINSVDISMINGVKDFMNKIFPIPELNTYMWEHLASILIGTNMNQTFNIYLGGGSNGKSKLTDLMSHVLGDYKSIIPIALLTDKRTGLGASCSELAVLKPTRLGVFQEGSKGMVLNEGPMKELTGDSTMQARQLYQETTTFKIQFKMIICTNTLFEINTDDDGTWRRIRICDFVSKFVDENKINDKYDTPYVFLKDITMDDKLITYAPAMLSLLTEIAFKTEGIVKDCSMVLSASNRYRNSQDFMNAFLNDKIIKTSISTDILKKTDIQPEFKAWFIQEQGTQKKIPKASELYEAIDKKFGMNKQGRWIGLTINYNDRDESNTPPDISTTDNIIELLNK